MASLDDPKPEGTDRIIDDVEDAEFEAAPAIGGDRVDFEPAGDSAGGSAFRAKADELRGQATDSARDYARQGIASATAQIDGVVQMIDDVAAQIDDKLGAQYGDYARRAGGTVSAFADSLRDKDIDELFDDARALVQKSPAVAIGAAAALGFVVARVIRAGAEQAAEFARDADKPKRAA